MERQYHSIPILQLRPDMLLAYSLPVDRLPRRKGLFRKDQTAGEKATLKKSGNQWNQGAYSGEMTRHSAKRCKKAINTLLAIAEEKTALNFKTGRHFKFKINFITLTLPTAQGEISDKEIKKEVLDVFIKSARRKWKLKSYIWKAERQQNGNLHFHLTSDTYIPYDQLRDTWNHCLERLGYITKFEQKHGHRNPNSTDVHATKGIKHLKNYLVEYFTKGHRTVERCTARPPWKKPELRLKPLKEGENFKRVLTNEEAKIEGKTWDCSQNLKLKDRAELEITATTHQHLTELIERIPDRVKITDHCTMIFLTHDERRKLIPPEWNITYEQWRKRVIDYERTKPEKEECAVPNAQPPDCPF